MPMHRSTEVFQTRGKNERNKERNPEKKKKVKIE